MNLLQIDARAIGRLALVGTYTESGRRYAHYVTRDGELNRAILIVPQEMPLRTLLGTTVSVSITTVNGARGFVGEHEIGQPTTQIVVHRIAHNGARFQQTLNSVLLRAPLRRR